MPEHYSSDRILAAPADLRPGGIDRLNGACEAAGLGRPLGHTDDRTPEVAVLRVAGADPVAVREAVRTARERGEDLPELTPDFQYVVSTVEDGAVDRDLFFAAGKKIGHGSGRIAWVPVPPVGLAAVPAWRDAAELPGGVRPTVALLDTGVRDHTWLPMTVGDDAFLIHAPGWTPPLPIRPPANGTPGSHWGHGTFIAGLIRREAPDVQVHSLRVMGDDGRASDHNVAQALRWLADYRHLGRPVDVVCLAFGRRAETDDTDMRPVREAIRELLALGVTVVASAGNDRSTYEVFPAAFATDYEVSAAGGDAAVVSVGAGVSQDQRDPFSNWGTWVTSWVPGRDVVSIMPMTTDRDADTNGFARWSGTSFSCAIRAGRIAQSRVRGRVQGRAGARETSAPAVGP